MAEKERLLLTSILGRTLITIFHIGSTVIPTLWAKPIIDLMPVVSSLEELDQHRTSIEGIGYQWRGEYGLPGRRYCVKINPVTSRKLIHLHCYVAGSFEIDRHLAFEIISLAIRT
jgi:GrpB-like predicted nucleotidyltransferase (UPF0157 family)